MFKAILIEKGDDGQRVGIQTLDEAQLPEGDVTVKVECSTLNYKDGLAITGKGPVVKTFPMVPGIDFAGTVESSSSDNYKPGMRSCSTAGALVKSTGAGWPKRPGWTAAG